MSELSFIPFPLGQVTATRSIVETLPYEQIESLVINHMMGNWGDVCETDWQANDKATHNGSRIVASHSVDGEKVFIITEANRSVTTLMFAYEY